ncbi:MAG: hypothetical protein LBM04_00475 [Opitutaceae bacterium]|nr:hypothetical protein [Opitutaceae bacterium]
MRTKILLACILLINAVMLISCSKINTTQGPEALDYFNKYFDSNIKTNNIIDYNGVYIKNSSLRRSVNSIFIRISSKDGKQWIRENMPHLYLEGVGVGGMNIWAGVHPPNVSWWDASNHKETWIAYQGSSVVKNANLTVSISHDTSDNDVIHIWGTWAER